MTLPRGLRNNSPGNIEDGPFARRQIGYSGKEPAGRFATFQTMAHGLAALIRLLRVYRHQHKLSTVRGIINRWAPPVENQTSAYVSAVSRWVGVGPDEELKDDRLTYRRLAEAIARHENGSPADEIPSSDYEDALSIVFADPQQVLTPTPWPFPSTPKEAPKMPLPAFVAAALPALIEAAPNLIRIFGSGEQSEKNAKAAEVVAEVAKAATGQPTIEQATQAIQSEPEAREAFRQQIESKWYELTEAGGGGIQGAREHSAKLQGDRSPLFNPALWVSAVLMIPVFMLLSDVFYVHPETYSGELRTQIVTAVLTIIGLVAAYWLGSSMSSRQKDEALLRR